MLFNSLEFLVFFPVVVMAYFALPHRVRWVFLLAASYFFYASWEPKYLLLIVVSTLIDYIAALQMGKTGDRRVRRRYLVLSLVSNLGLLFAFKYFNFFTSNFTFFFDFYGLPRPVLQVLLPVGISFYTFQTMSYTIDVYRGERAPERHLGYFALFVAFFPQLVAGPIERSSSLLPQFFERHKIDMDRIRSGLLLMLGGYFMKLVIADRLAVYVNAVYNNAEDYTGLPVILATYFFAFQIFCDFAGYSSIAIGAARIMGFDLMENFRRPYSAVSISDFWRRWHISLSTWMRDYLYISLGGNRVSTRKWYRNLMLTFLLSGLWHGANWTFIVWGFLHGAYLVTSILTASARQRLHKAIGLTRVPRLHHAFQVVLTFHLVLVAWVFFRANSLSDALLLFRNMFVGLKWPDPAVFAPMNGLEIAVAAGSILLLEAVHLAQSRGSVESWVTHRALPIRWGLYYAMFFAIILFGKFTHQEFIYFQF